MARTRGRTGKTKSQAPARTAKIIAWVLDQLSKRASIARVMRQRDEPHREASPGSCCRRPCACRLHLDAAAAASLDYKSRAVTRTEGGVRVSTAVLSADESATVYGVPLADESIQPVWIEVENREDRAYYLLSPGLDPNFFPASEASEAVRIGRVAGPESRARPALSPAGLPQPCPSRRHEFGVRADEPRRGFQVRPDRPGLERAGKNLLDPLHRARLSRRLPCERSLQAGYLPAREDP